MERFRTRWRSSSSSPESDAKPRTLFSATRKKNEGIVVDTHVARLSHRLGLTRGTDPEKIEQELMKFVPRELWTLFSHWLIWHGRRRCYARSPDCPNCEIQKLCPSAG